MSYQGSIDVTPRLVGAQQGCEQAKFQRDKKTDRKKKRNQEKKAQKRQKDKRAKGKRPKDKASSSPQIRVCVCGVPQKSPTQVGIGCIVCRWCESSYHRRYNMYERYPYRTWIISTSYDTVLAECLSSDCVHLFDRPILWEDNTGPPVCS